MLIRTSGLAVSLAGRQVLDDVDFEIARGEIVTVIGPNGSGKSTLLRALIGAIGAAKGRIERKQGLTIGYVPQRLALSQSMPMTVARFLALPQRRGAGEILAALERTGAAGIETAQMAALSGGQFQRVLLARAILAKPDLLVLDEPTQGLDQPGIARFYDLIADLRAELGCAVLMVSHELHVVMGASDRVICLNGHVCCQGAPEAVSANPEYRALFGDATGTLALYRHAHDHDHDHDHDDAHDPSHRADEIPYEAAR